MKKPEGLLLPLEARTWGLIDQARDLVVQHASWRSTEDEEIFQYIAYAVNELPKRIQELEDEVESLKDLVTDLKNDNWYLQRDIRYLEEQ